MSESNQYVGEKSIFLQIYQKVFIDIFRSREFEHLYSTNKHRIMNE